MTLTNEYHAGEHNREVEKRGRLLSKGIMQSPEKIRLLRPLMITNRSQMPPRQSQGLMQ
jgi:hypothetical protein